MLFPSVFAAIVLFIFQVTATTLQIYEPAHIYSLSDSFTLTVNGKQVPVLDFEGYDYAHFSFGGGPAKITIEAQQEVSRFSTSPRSYGYDKSGALSENKLTFTMESPHYVIVQLKGAGEIVIAADPLETDVPPSQGTGIFNVVKYGADQKGKHLSTTAFSNALDKAGSHGAGSIVYVPPGVFQVGNIVIPSRVSLYLSPGSVLLFTGNRADYKKEWTKKSQNMDGTEWIRTAYDSHSIKIYGRGTIDANGAYATKKGKFLAHAVVPLLTTEFTYDGPIIRDSASWTLIPTRSSSVTIDHAKIFNRMSLAENDAVDIQESQNVVVQNSIGIALDDSFSTKSWAKTEGIAASWPGKSQPVRDVTFTNCLAWTSCYGFKVGQGAFEEQSNIHFEDSTVYHGAIGLGIHHMWGTAPIHDVSFTRMTVDNLSGTNAGVGSWLSIQVQDGVRGVAGPVSNVIVSDITVYDRGDTPVTIHGIKGSEISSVDLKKVWFSDLGRMATSMKEMGLTRVKYATGISLRH